MMIATCATSTIAFAARTGSIQAPIKEASHLPGEIYTSAAIAQREKERIFLCHWLCVAREEELAKPGDYMALRIAGEPLLLSRGADGSLAACMNVCLHRGVEVVQGEGNAELLRCPYHAWTYDLAGRLVGAPRMKEAGRDMKDCRLPQVKLETWRGWVFINFDPQAGAFSDFIAPFEQQAWWYRTQDCRIAKKLVLEVNCNWKFIAENLLDWYHASTVHAGTFGKYYRLGPETLPAKLLPEGGSLIEFDASTRSHDPNLPFPRLPWLQEQGVFSAKGAMFPNLNFWSGADSLRMWQLWPLDVDRTRAICYIMLPPSSFEVEGFDAKLAQYAAYVEQVALEDRGALESLQRGVSSSRFKPGPLSHLELQLQHLLKHYVDVMAFE